MEQTILESKQSIDLSSVEGSVLAPPPVLQVLKNQTPGTIASLPSKFEYEKLQRALASYYHLSPAQILLGNGSDEIIEAIARDCSQRGRSATVVTPSFRRLMTSTEKCGVLTHTLELQESQEFAHNSSFQKKLVSHIRRKRPGLVWLCSPNNPSGRVTTLKFISEIREILEQNDSVLAIDEVFIDFAKDAEASSSRELLTGGNLLVVNSFTKSWGLGALRVGFAMGDKALMRRIAQYILHYNLSSIAVEAAIAALENCSYRIQFLQQNRKLRKALEEELLRFDNISFVRDSETNFVMMRGLRYLDLHSELLKRGIITKDLSQHYPRQTQSYIRCRIPVDQDEYDLLLSALTDIDRVHKH